MNYYRYDLLMLKEHYEDDPFDLIDAAELIQEEWSIHSDSAFGHLQDLTDNKYIFEIRK